MPPGLAPLRDNPRDFELAVSPGHRIGIDDELFRQHPDRRHLFFWQKAAGCDQESHDEYIKTLRK